MIALTPRMRVLVAVAPADFRCGIDGLARRVRQALAESRLGGAVFVFRNRRGTAVKLLAYEPKKSSTHPWRAVSSPHAGTRGDESPAMPGPVNPAVGAIRGR